MRLDQYLSEQGKVFSRNKAQELVRSGKVTVAGKVVTKPSHKVEADDDVIIEPTAMYVSRAALKLKGFLPSLPFSVEGMEALDIGASTGGFTQVLLEERVTQVDAVDVGVGQLHPEISGDDRVTSWEGTDIRHFDPKKRYDVVVSDVSFISLQYILDDVDRLALRWIVLLFKPQYEVGREAKRDRHGVVQDTAAIAEAMQRFETACHLKGWHLIAKEASTLPGKEGNIEYCYCYERS